MQKHHTTQNEEYKNTPSVTKTNMPLSITYKKQNKGKTKNISLHHLFPSPSIVKSFVVFYF